MIKKTLLIYISIFYVFSSSNAFAWKNKQRAYAYNPYMYAMPRYPQNYQNYRFPAFSRQGQQMPWGQLGRANLFNGFPMANNFSMPFSGMSGMSPMGFSPMSGMSPMGFSPMSGMSPMGFGSPFSSMSPMNPMGFASPFSPMSGMSGMSPMGFSPMMGMSPMSPMGFGSPFGMSPFSSSMPFNKNRFMPF